MNAHAARDRCRCQLVARAAVSAASAPSHRPLVSGGSAEEVAAMPAPLAPRGVLAAPPPVCHAAIMPLAAEETMTSAECIAWTSAPRETTSDEGMHWRAAAVSEQPEAGDTTSKRVSN